MGAYEVSELLSFAVGLFVGIVAVIVSSAAAYLHHLHRQYDHIPGPRRTSFWLGNFSEIRKEFKEGSFFQEMTVKLLKRFGHTYCIFILHRVSVFTVDPETIKKLLVTDGGYMKSQEAFGDIQYIFGERFFGRGLVSELDDVRWSRHRSIMNPAFGKKFLMEQFDNFNEIIDQLVIKLSKVANGKTVVSMHKELSHVALDVIGKVAFGMDINSVNETKPFCQAITIAFQGFAERGKDPFIGINPFKMGYRAEVRKAIRLLRQTAQDIIQSRMHAMKAGDYIPKDILSYIMQMAGTNVTMQDLIDNFVTFFVAGQETTANMMSFALLEVGRRPEIYKKMRDEVDAILGERRFVTYDDVGKMEYMSQVIKEALRLYPPVPTTFREPSEPQTIGGYIVPARTMVVLSMYACQRLEGDIEFNPDKFAKDQAKQNVYTYFPFSLGPHICIGQTFAKLEAKVILAKFLQRFDMKLDQTQSFDILESGTLRPKSGVMCSLTLRENVA